MFTPKQSIRTIINEHASAVQVLGRFAIDPGEQGEESLELACAAGQLSIDQVLEKLEDAAAHEAGGVEPDVCSYSLTRLIQHIVRVHHRCVREQLPQLIEMSRISALRNCPNVPRVTSLLEDLRHAMLAHFQREEQILFPYIAQLDADPQTACLPPDAAMGGLAGAMLVMAQEHEAVLRILDELATIAENSPREEAPGCRELYSDVQAFIHDLERHVELEDECLFPRAMQTESALRLGGRR